MYTPSVDSLYAFVALNSNALAVATRPEDSSVAKDLNNQVLAKIEEMPWDEVRDLLILMSSVFAGAVMTSHDTDLGAIATWEGMVSEIFEEFGYAHLDPTQGL
jgi:hypothetical protein